MANTPTREHREAACEVANGDKCRTWDDDRFIAGELPDPRSAWRINERIAQALADAEQRGFERGREAERAEVVRYPEASEKDEAMSETNRPECIHGIGLCTGSCQREPSKELLEAQAKVDAIARQVRELQAAKATQPPPESAEPAPVATDTQAREACQQQAEREVVERWKGANGYNDLLQAYGAAIDERDRLRNTLPATETESPTCSGEWLSGSGGHRVFGGCDKPATWVETEGGAAACDEHLGQHVRRAAGDLPQRHR